MQITADLQTQKTSSDCCSCCFLCISTTEHKVPCKAHKVLHKVLIMEKYPRSRGGAVDFSLLMVNVSDLVNVLTGKRNGNDAEMKRN